MKRRTFLQGLQLGVPLYLATANGHDLLAANVPGAAKKIKGWSGSVKEQKCDVFIAGGGLGSCAAALAAAGNGLRVIMTEETSWIGGQISQQAVPPDENGWIEDYGGTLAYRQFRKAIRDYYKRNYPLTDEAMDNATLNPGMGGVSRLCHEPRIALAVLYEILAPYISNDRLVLLLNSSPVRADVNGDRVNAVTVRNLITGNEIAIQADYFIDGTELGDLLPMTKTEYVTGAEAKSETGEPHAADKANPQDMQAITWCFAMDYIDGEDHTIDKPAQYDFWRDYVPKMEPAWPGKQLSWVYSHPITLEPITRYCNPIAESANEENGFWRYRRIAYKGNFKPGFYQSDICLVNWPMNDYWLGNIIEVSEEEAAKHLDGAMQLSLSLFYWMQTEAPRSDGGTGWPGLRLRGDVCGTEHGLAMYPYIRESRRIQAEFTVLEQHVGLDARMEITGKKKGEVTAEVFPDTVGIGSYRIDLHPSTANRNYIDISSLPFQIPLGALIPKRMENLLPACKNLGVTHITNGCYRLHPVEWNIGEAAGALVAFCLQRDKAPRQVRNDQTLLAEFQESLKKQGFELEWREDAANSAR